MYTHISKGDNFREGGNKGKITRAKWKKINKKGDYIHT